MNWTTKYLTENRNTVANITYTQAGVSCFVGQDSGIFEVPFFVVSSVVKIPACAYLQNVELNRILSSPVVFYDNFEI